MPSLPATVSVQTAVSGEPVPASVQPVGYLRTAGSDDAFDMTVISALLGAEDAPRMYAVCIDAGHQAVVDARKEPLGPDSAVMDKRMNVGGSGVATKIPEYETNLAIATMLKLRLEEAGVTVVMVRTSNDADLSNIERVALANSAKADLYMRIHCDSFGDSRVSGTTTLYPADIPWTHSIVGASYDAAFLIQGAVVAETGARDRGLRQREDLTAFNWSQVPSVLMETGFLSNSTEDRLLNSPEYQDKIARGMTAGIMAFLKSR